MYAYDAIKKLLSSPVAKALLPIPAVSPETEDDTSTYDLFAETTVSAMSSEYGADITAIKTTPWVKEAFAFCLDFFVSSTLPAISEGLQKKIADNFSYAKKLLRDNRSSTTNAGSRVGSIEGLY